MSDFYCCDIRFPDDPDTLFEQMVFCEYDGLPDNSPVVDDDVFYYGLSRESAEQCIGQTTGEDYIIERVYDLPTPVPGRTPGEFDTSLSP